MEGNGRTMTKGDVIIEEIKIGDTHYEFAHGCGIESKVITLPVRDEDGWWHWQSQNVRTGKIINYGQREGYEHYGLNLYTTIAYDVNIWV